MAVISKGLQNGTDRFRECLTRLRGHRSMYTCVHGHSLNESTLKLERGRGKPAGHLAKRGAILGPTAARVQAEMSQSPCRRQLRPENPPWKNDLGTVGTTGPLMVTQETKKKHR